MLGGVAVVAFGGAFGAGSASGSASAATATEAPQFSTFGMAVPGGHVAGFTAATANGLPVQWARLYATGVVPPTFSAWPDAVDASNMGLKLWLSIWLDPVQLAAGTYDAALTSLAPTLPAGTRLTLDHEPSTVAKHLTAAVYKAGFEHGSAIIQQASAGLVLTGPIDVRSNVIRYHFLDSLDPRYVQFVGMDAYDGINGGPPGQSLQAVAAAAYAHLRTVFPAAQTGFAEFNSSRTTGRAQWVADALTWGQSVGASPMLLFTAFPIYRLTSTEQQDLSRLITVPVPPLPARPR